MDGEQPGISGFSIEGSKFVLKTIEQIFGSIPNGGDSVDNLSNKSYEYLEYLRNCVISGMKKYLEKNEQFVRKYEIGAKLNETIAFGEMVSEVLGDTLSIKKSTKEIEKQQKEVQAICDDCINNNLGATTVLDKEQTRKIDDWIRDLPVLKVEKANYESWAKGNPNAPQNMTTLNEILSKAPPIPKKLSERQSHLINIGKFIDKVLNMTKFEFYKIAMYLSLMSDFSYSNEHKFITSANDKSCDNNWYYLHKALKIAPCLSEIYFIKGCLERRDEGWRNTFEQVASSVLKAVSEESGYGSSQMNLNDCVNSKSRIWNFAALDKLFDRRSDAYWKFTDSWKKKYPKQKVLKVLLEQVSSYCWRISKYFNDDKRFTKFSRFSINKKKIENLQLDDALEEISRCEFLALMDNLITKIKERSSSASTGTVLTFEYIDEFLENNKVKPYTDSIMAINSVLSVAKCYSEYVGPFYDYFLTYLREAFSNYITVSTLNGDRAKTVKKGTVRWIEEYDDSEKPYIWLQIKDFSNFCSDFTTVGDNLPDKAMAFTGTDWYCSCITLTGSVKNEETKQNKKYYCIVDSAK